MQRHPGATLAVLMALISFSPSSAEEPAESRAFALQHREVRDVATIVRTIAGVRDLTVVDDGTLEVTGPGAVVRLAAELVSALDVSEIDPDQTFTTGDETTVAIIPLGATSPREAMSALRELQIQRIAASLEPPLLVVRDRPERVALAIEALDGT